jgi:hypothetical protein
VLRSRWGLGTEKVMVSAPGFSFDSSMAALRVHPPPVESQCPSMPASGSSRATSTTKARPEGWALGEDVEGGGCGLLFWQPIATSTIIRNARIRMRSPDPGCGRGGRTPGPIFAIRIDVEPPPRRVLAGGKLALPSGARAVDWSFDSRSASGASAPAPGSPTAPTSCLLGIPVDREDH